MSERTGHRIRTVWGVALLGAVALLRGASPAVAENHPEARFRGTGKADPIRIENVRQADGPAAGQSSVTFDLAWDHSWRAAWEVAPEQHGGKGTLKLENWDAAWVFAKYRKPGADGYSHATLSKTKADHRVPAGATLDVGLSDDGKRGLGVFVYRAAPSQGANDWKGVTLRWLHGGDGVAGPGAVDLKVLAIEMVHVPQCAFWVGDGTTNLVAGQFSAGHSANPFRIESERALTLGGESARNLNNRDGIGMAGADDFHSDFMRTLPERFPKGYAAFYCMKHEITQRQYVEFLNTLSSGQQARLTGGKSNAAAGTRFMYGGPNSAYGRNGIRLAVPAKPSAVQAVPRRDAVVASISRPATPAVYETDAPYVACTGMLWSDGMGYAAWSGLRPMTELEFEKACRGPLKPVPDEYAWGTPGIAGTNAKNLPRDGYALQNPNKPEEHVTWEGANGPDAVRGNAAWWGTVQQARASYAVHAINGPLRAGIFATPNRGRVAAGASYWGIMELSGNLWEPMVTVGSDVGRRFAGTHGKGTVVHPAGWGSIDSSAFRRRGGSFGRWGDRDGTLRTSDRWGGSGGWGLRSHQWHMGFRCVRTAP